MAVIAETESNPEALPEDLPRIQPTPLDEVLQTFEVKSGFTLELAAQEPLVEDPIDAVFDEDGGLYVVEMRGYSERRDAKRGRIRLLHDDDDDGVFERASDYVSGLRWPTSVACFNGGVFIAETPDILYCKDTNGDGVADSREVVFTGFGSGKDRLNVQAIVNGLQWGPDNRLWGATSMNGGEVGPPGGTTIRLNGQDFSFDPRLRDLRAENGTAQNGMSFDTRGRRYVCSNSNHLIAVMWERDWSRANPHYRLPNPLQGIATDGGAAPVFRLSPDEPWRIVRTRWRVAGVVGGPVEGGGRVSGYFTGASGVTIYTGDAFGADFVDNAFTGDVGSNLVHRKVIKRQFPRGLSLLAERPEDEVDHEFIASRDNWFRPANFANGPDGCLYIIDMHREVIEHPWSLPLGIKKHLDLNSGADRGRIYRVKPKAFTRRATAELSGFSNDELANTLKHGNGWHRVTAQRLLWERGDQRAGEGWGGGSLRRSLDVQSLEELEQRLASEDSWLQASALHSLRDPEEAAQIFARLQGPPKHSVARLVGRSQNTLAIDSVIRSLVDTDHLHALRLLNSLAEGLREANVPVKLGLWFQTALQLVQDESATMETRVAAAALLEYFPSEVVVKALLGPLQKAKSEAFQRQLIVTLDQQPGNEFAALIVERWAGFSESARSVAIDALLRQSDRIMVLLESIRSKAFSADVLSVIQVNQLRRHRKAEIVALVESLFPQEQRRSVKALLEAYRPALTLKGDPKRGVQIFRERCLSCHQLGGEGQSLGPEVVTFKTAGRESLLTNLLDPNREVAPRYQAYVVTLVDDNVLTGIIASETPSELTVRQPNVKDTITVRKHVRSMQSLGASLMPEGLEAGLSAQAMADLLAFISGESF
jgi:putative membrane-bound dehydrogenase-like protein